MFKVCATPTAASETAESLFQQYALASIFALTHILLVPTTVLVTKAFEAWFVVQTAQVKKQVNFVIGLLEMEGVELGAPYSSAIKGADISLRELRPASGKSPARVFYAFDPDRNAVVLCGGSKNDAGDLYETAKSTAKTEFESHLKAIAEEKEKKRREDAKRKKRK